MVNFNGNFNAAVIRVLGKRIVRTGYRTVGFEILLIGPMQVVHKFLFFDSDIYIRKHSRAQIVRLGPKKWRRLQFKCRIPPVLSKVGQTIAGLKSSSVAETDFRYL